VTRYASSDIGNISAVPGCDQVHSRPVDPATGCPVDIWGLDCPVHEAWLRGDHKPKVLKYITDPKTGAVINQQRVPDSDPRWGATPDTIPLTPDETRTQHVKLEKGENQLRALEAMLHLKTGGIDITSRPEVLYYLQQSGLPQDMLQGKTVCPSGHDNPAGNAFCGTCGSSMSHAKAIEPAEEEPPADDLSQLHPQTLKKLCRQRGLPDSGSKDALIGRLQAA